MTKNIRVDFQQSYNSKLEGFLGEQYWGDPAELLGLDMIMDSTYFDVVAGVPPDQAYTGLFQDQVNAAQFAVPSIHGSGNAFEATESALGGAMAGAALGSLVGGPIGTAGGAIGGAVIGGIAGWFGSKEKDAKEKNNKIQALRADIGNIAREADTGRINTLKAMKGVLHQERLKQGQELAQMLGSGYMETSSALGPGTGASSVLKQSAAAAQQRAQDILKTGQSAFLSSQAAIQAKKDEIEDIAND